MLKVLHVDDDPDIRLVVGFALGLDDEMEVRQCDSGVDALACAADFAPDLFLLDWMMPNMSGEDLLEKLRRQERFAATPAIFLTASMQMEAHTRFERLDSVKIIQKPFDPLLLAEQVREIWKGMMQHAVAA